MVWKADQCGDISIVICMNSKIEYLHVGQISFVFSLFSAHTYFKDIQVTFDLAIIFNGIDIHRLSAWFVVKASGLEYQSHPSVYWCPYNCAGLFFRYRSGTVNSNTVNLKFHFIRSFCTMFSYCFPIISCLKCMVNSYFGLFRRKSLPTNDFELTVPDL